MSPTHPAKSARALFATFVVFGTAACAPYPVVDLPSTNHGSRIDYVVVHFTAEDFAESVRLLTRPSDNSVSSHYLVPDPDDPGYGRRLAVYRLVPEDRRAWHAGKSYWAGEVALNDCSIGIEIVNTSRCEADPEDAARPLPLSASCRLQPFDDRQIELVIELLRDILERYPNIDPEDVVGHADIAPARKFDPGPLFPWRRLYDAGIGAWYDEQTATRYLRHFERELPDAATVQSALRAWGFELAAAEANSLAFGQALRSFQMHFRPERVTAEPDAETVAILFSLLEKYRHDEPGVATLLATRQSADASTGEMRQ